MQSRRLIAFSVSMDGIERRSSFDSSMSDRVKLVAMAGMGGLLVMSCVCVLLLGMLSGMVWVLGTELILTVASLTKALLRKLRLTR